MTQWPGHEMKSWLAKGMLAKGMDMLKYVGERRQL